MHGGLGIFLDESNHSQLAAVVVQLFLRNVDSDHETMRFNLETLGLLTPGHVEKLVTDVDANTASGGTTSERTFNQ